MSNNSFVNAVKNQSSRTENGMKARASTASAAVDLFYNMGASRGKNIVPQFTAAMAENKEYALRIAQWARDVREGSGERQIFRDILKHLASTDVDAAALLLRKVPELGRWDDVLELMGSPLESKVIEMIGSALKAGDGLCAKWMPRQGVVAARIRNALGYSPKYYRKRLVELSKVVETQMCQNKWDEINFSHVPSVAASRYKKAFYRHTPKYAEYVGQLTKQIADPTVEKTVKVNASAIFPHDVLKGRITTPGYYGHKAMSQTELDLVNAQWAALPNFVGDKNVLAIVDVSGSMEGLPLEVAVSLGLYFADKNTGKFKDTFLTFSTDPQLLYLQGNINQKIDQMCKSSWAMSTNLHAAFEKILSVAKSGNVPQEEMPETLFILSDMQFNQCVRFDDSAIEMIRRKYEEAGYNLPQVVFWNLRAAGNAPVSMNEKGVALVSGFSPNIAETILAGDFEEFTPSSIMLKKIMRPRYDI